MSGFDSIEELYREARRAMRRAVAPCSRFKVGVSVLTLDGDIYTGCNIENPSLMMSECAERIALLKAVSEGAGGIRAMMIVSNRAGYCYPCGGCRQLIREFAPEAEIFVAGRRGIKKYTIDELLPHAFER